MSKTKNPSYYPWANMLARCYNPNATGYQRYGGRGISVCQEWRESFEKFCEDMGPRPEKHSIDRIDTNGNYTPENCKWSTQKEQCRNFATRNLIIVVDGITYKAADLADNSKYRASTIYSRLMSGMSVDEAVNGAKRPATNLSVFQEAGWKKRREQTHCKRGHEFTPENTYMQGTSRVCRECSNAKGRAWRAKRDANKTK